MVNMTFVLGALIGVIMSLFAFGAWRFAEQRKAARNLTTLEITAMAEKLGLKLDLARLGETAEGDRLLGAMVRCNECTARQACHGFLADDAADVGRLASFCPNAVYLFGLAEIERRGEPMRVTASGA